MIPVPLVLILTSRSTPLILLIVHRPSDCPLWRVTRASIVTRLLDLYIFSIKAWIKIVALN